MEVQIHEVKITVLHCNQATDRLKKRDSDGKGLDEDTQMDDDSVLAQGLISY